VRQGWDIIPHPKTQFDPSIQRPHHPKRGDKMDKVIFALIADERKRQIEKWGVQRHAPGKWTMILIEEIGEACQALLQQRETDAIHELVQAAAVIVTWIEALKEILEEPKTKDDIPYGKLGYALLKHLRKQRYGSVEADDGETIRTEGKN